MKISRLRLWLQNNRMWIHMIRNISFSLLLVLLVGFVDLRHPEWHAFIPEVLLMNVGLSTTLLTTLAGALLTITTFTFSTLMTVMNMYSNSYSPRMVSNFTEKKTVNRVLGVFVGGFLYCVLTLFVIGGIYEKQRVVAGGISLVYATFCMFHFILFVHEVIRMTSGSNVVQSVYQEALPVIDAQVAKRRRSLSLQTTECERSIKIYALSTGYLNRIDVARIVRHVQGQKGILQIERHLGDYIVKGFHLATLHLTKDWSLSGDESKEFLDGIADCFITQEEKSADEDYRFSINKLVEVTLRAVGSGANDSATGTHCIRKICLLLGKLFAVGTYRTVLNEETSDLRLLYVGYSPEEELYYSFHQILNIARTQPALMDGLLQGLYITQEMAHEQVKEVVRNYAAHVFDTAMDAIPDAYDRAYLKRTYAVFTFEQADAVNREIMEEEA